MAALFSFSLLLFPHATPHTLSFSESKVGSGGKTKKREKKKEASEVEKKKTKAKSGLEEEPMEHDAVATRIGRGGFKRPPRECRFTLVELIKKK